MTEIDLRRGDFEAMHPTARLLNFDAEKMVYFGDKSESINSQWTTWCSCIGMLHLDVKEAQAVPEGFILVKKVHPDAIVHNQGLGLFKECQVIYGWDGKSKDFKEALNKGFYHGVKLGAKAVLETTMIEAQDPAND